MTETSEPRGSHSTYDFGINLKCTPGRSRILSPMSPSLQREYPAIAWTVRWVLSVRRRAKDKSARVESRCEVTVDMSTGKTFVLYRRQMLKLLRSLVFYEDMKRDYDRFQLALMQEVAAQNA